jgi:hypothetical protein
LIYQTTRKRRSSPSPRRHPITTPCRSLRPSIYGRPLLYACAYWRTPTF